MSTNRYNLRSKEQAKRPRASESDDEKQSCDVQPRKKKYVIDDSSSEEDTDYAPSRVDEVEKEESLDEAEEEEADHEDDGEEAEEEDEDEAEEEEDGDDEEDDEAEEDPDADWEQDDTMLKSFLMRGIKKQFPDLDDEKLEEALTEVCKNAKGILTEFCEARPKDVRWKAKLDEETVAKLEPILKKVREDIEAEEPTMAKILAAPLTDKERKDTVKTYDIYCNEEPYTGDYMRMRNHLIKILETYNNAEQLGQRVKVDEEACELMKKQPPTDMFGLKLRICNLETSDENKVKLLGMHRELSETSEDSNTSRTLKEKLEWSVSLPFNRIKLPDVQFGKNTAQEINDYCGRVRAAMDKSLYGMKKAKDALIGILANRISNPRCPSMIGLRGPPGVGKTALGSAFGKALGLPYERIALGGMEEATQLKGSDSHWVGSSPSLVLQKMRNMKVANGILGFDEIDKLSATHHGRAVGDALLHITDYTQNDKFDDGFLTEIPHNLSLLWFFFMFNDYNAINPILRNRITNVIDVDPYTHTDLKNIITYFVLPKCLTKVGIPLTDVSIEEQACYSLIHRVIPGSADSGVRPIEDALDRLVTCINVNRVCTLPDGTLGSLSKEFKIPGFKMPLVITSGIVERFLEHAKAVVQSYFS